MAIGAQRNLDNDAGADRASALPGAEAQPSSGEPTNVTASAPDARGFAVETIPGLQALWAETLGDPDVMIAVLDGPVDLSHDCFAGAAIAAPVASAGPAAITATVEPIAAAHGTHVASVIFGQHDSGANDSVKGIAPRCRGVILPVFHRRADGSLAPCSQTDLARAITQAVQLAEQAGARALVINISGGQFAESGQAHPLLADVIRQCDRRRVLIVAAAGNQGCDCLHVPGAVPSVLVVGAMTADGEPLEFSNWGQAYRQQGILAPGDNIVGALPAGGTTLRTGTSFATPIVAGVAALLLSLQIARGETPNAEQVRAALLRSAIGCDREPANDCRRLLAGRLAIPISFDVPFSNLMVASSGGAPPAPHSQTPTGALDLRPEPDHSLSHGEYTMSDVSISAAPEVLADAFPPAGPLDLSPPQVIAAGLDEDARTRATTTPGGVTPSDCGCGGKCGGGGGVKAPPVLQKVFALGKLSFDYGSRPRRQYFLNEMRKSLGPEFRGVDDPATLYTYLTRVDKPERRYTILDEHRFTSRAEVTSINWVLQLNDTPVYAIVPLGAFAHEIHDLLVSFLNDQLVDGAERISLPGVIVGQVTLFTGEVVPVVQPDIRGMFSWKTSALIDAIQKQVKGDRAADHPLQDFLNRVYSQTHNLGLTSQDRAINFAATDALMNAGIFRKVRKEHAELEFDSFTVDRSPICRPDADCWDVVLFFYDPTNLMRARRAIRYTVDVTDVVPIIVGEQREYSMR